LDTLRYSKILLEDNMGRGKVFQCEVTISSAVKEKLLKKHNIEIWEVEEVIYDDPHAFSITYRDCYFIYGQTFSGRYLLILIRLLSSEEVTKLGFNQGINFIKIITARDMNKNQRKMYYKKRGII
jgi:uncharacterized DUF497 family protein